MRKPAHEAWVRADGISYNRNVKQNQDRVCENEYRIVWEQLELAGGVNDDEKWENDSGLLPRTAEERCLYCSCSACYWSIQ